MAMRGWIPVLCVLLCPAVFLCPILHFPCGNLTICVPRDLICNEKLDCPNGEDESNCTYPIPDNIIPPRTVLPPHLWDTPYNATCILSGFPVRCKCTTETWLYCLSLDLKTFPLHISPQVTKLILNNNSISRLRQQDLAQYQNLTTLSLESNLLERLEKNTFRSLPVLKNLWLKWNRISYIEVGAFNGLVSLNWLILIGNRLTNFETGVFAHLPALHKLDLRQNHIHLQGGFVFPSAPKLEWLLLEGNSVEQLPANTFSRLDFLKILDLAANEMWVAQENAFKGLSSLQELNLKGNNFRHFPASFFQDIPTLLRIKLDDNPFTTLPQEIFAPVKNLTSLSLVGIELSNISVRHFDCLLRLEFAYFKKFHYCSFVPRVRVCKPNTDGISSIDNLLDRQVQRFSVWVVAVLTCLGNAGVLCGRAVARLKNPIPIHKCQKSVHFLFTCNLAAADLLMGIYLMVIGGHDLFFRDKYNTHASSWMASWRCVGAGILAMTSSEASLLILTFMSLERFLCLGTTFAGIRLSPRAVFRGLLAVWWTSLILAIFPVLRWSQLPANAFYGSNGLCFPLHIDDPFLVGWQYSLFVFVVLNGCGVVLISSAYVGLFAGIRRTTRATSRMGKDAEFAFRFLFIVMTDCACWIPIILIKIAALNQARISADLYAWVVVFILPINSALNPFIYTFSTTKFKKRVRKVFVSQTFLPAWLASNSRKDSADMDTTSASSKRSLPKTGYHPVPKAVCFPFMGQAENDLPPPPYLAGFESCI